MDLGDDAAHLHGRLFAARAELFHLRRDDREAAAGLARFGGLDARVDGQQIRLSGELGHRGVDLRDRLRLFAEGEDALGQHLHPFLRFFTAAHALDDRLTAVLGGMTDALGEVRDEARLPRGDFRRLPHLEHGHRRLAHCRRLLGR